MPVINYYVELHNHKSLNTRPLCKHLPQSQSTNPHSLNHSCHVCISVSACTAPCKQTNTQHTHTYPYTTHTTHIQCTVYTQLHMQTQGGVVLACQRDAIIFNTCIDDAWWNPLPVMYGVHVSVAPQAKSNREVEPHLTPTARFSLSVYIIQLVKPHSGES